MIEAMKVLLHSVGITLKERGVEILGYSVSGTLLIISQMPLLDLIEKSLQIVVLLVSIAGGIMTFLYVRRKYKNLSK
jgi:hypothetical protein